MMFNVQILSLLLVERNLFSKYRTSAKSLRKISIPSWSCLDGVQEANNVRVIRKELVPWSNGLETEEEEVPDHVLVVVVQPIKTGDHMGHLKLFLSILEQRDKGPLGALSKLVRSDAHIKSLLPHDGLPVGAGAAKPCSGEADLGGSIGALLLGRVGRSCIFVLVGFLSIVLKVRGISVVPRASALWELPTCAGNIKPAVEARRPSSWWRWS